MKLDTFFSRRSVLAGIGAALARAVWPGSGRAAGGGGQGARPSGAEAVGAASAAGGAEMRLVAFGRRTSFTFDADGRLLKAVRVVQRSTFTYEADGRLVETFEPVGEPVITYYSMKAEG